jgi:formiminoglutamase
LAEDGCKVLLSIDADAFAARDVPGVSAPNPLGFAGDEGANAAFAAGAAAEVSSFELVEINPLFDLDGRSAHWAAATIWHFLIGLSQRAKAAKAVVG